MGGGDGLDIEQCLKTEEEEEEEEEYVIEVDVEYAKEGKRSLN